MLYVRCTWKRLYPADSDPAWNLLPRMCRFLLTLGLHHTWEKLPTYSRQCMDSVPVNEHMQQQTMLD